MEYRVLTRAMNVYPYQQLYFTTLEYDELCPVFSKAGNVPQLSALKDINVMLLTGIASPQQIEHDLAPYTSHLTPLTFPDHHQFRQKDIQLINDTFAAMPSPKCIITTEKDTTRLLTAQGLSDEVRNNLFMLPVRISFMQDQEEVFNNYIIGYVRKNSRNSILVKREDDNKPDNRDYSGDRPRTISFRNN